MNISLRNIFIASVFCIGILIAIFGFFHAYDLEMQIEDLEQQRLLYQFTPNEYTLINRNLSKKIELGKEGKFEYNVKSNFEASSCSDDLYLNIEIQVFINGDFKKKISLTESDSGYCSDDSDSYASINVDESWISEEYSDEAYTTCIISASSNYLDWQVNIRYINDQIIEEEAPIRAELDITYGWSIGLLIFTIMFGCISFIFLGKSKRKSSFKRKKRERFRPTISKFKPELESKTIEKVKPEIQQVQRSYYCSLCGSPYSEGLQICQNCGNKLV